MPFGFEQYGRGPPQLKAPCTAKRAACRSSNRLIRLVAGRLTCDHCFVQLRQSIGSAVARVRNKAWVGGCKRGKMPVVSRNLFWRRGTKRRSFVGGTVEETLHHYESFMSMPKNNARDEDNGPSTSFGHFCRVLVFSALPQQRRRSNTFSCIAAWKIADINQMTHEHAHTLEIIYRDLYVWPMNYMRCLVKILRSG